MLTGLGWATVAFGAAVGVAALWLWTMLDLPPDPVRDRREVLTWLILSCLASFCGCAYVVVWAWTRF